MTCHLSSTPVDSDFVLGDCEVKKEVCKKTVGRKMLGMSSWVKEKQLQL